MQIAEEDTADQGSSKQIPVISDIERIKKVIEILEFVGEKVDGILQVSPAAESSLKPSVISRDDSKAVKGEKSLNPEETTEKYE